MGLFSKSEIKKVATIEKDPTTIISDCMKCGLYRKNTARSRTKLEAVGEGKKKILIIGGTTTEDDETFGSPFAGAEGELLDSYLKKQKIKLQSDCWRVKAVRCKAKSPTYDQIRACHPYLDKFIKVNKPKTIFLMGHEAISSFYGQEFSNRDPIRWRVYCIPDQYFQCNVIPLYSIRSLMENDKDKNLKCMFERDIKFAVQKAVNSVFKQQLNHEQCVTLLKDFRSLKAKLQHVLESKPIVAYDYETTGLKPFKDNHKIATIAFAISETEAYSFPYQYRDFWTREELQEIHDLWQAILKDPQIKKVAQNSKFEEVWGAIFFKARHKWHFDTLMCAHIMDNRHESTGLKFQAFVQFGVRPYDKDIQPFLKAKGEYNTVEKAALQDLLIYNGLDCIYTYMLYKIHLPFLSARKGLLSAYNFFMEGNKEMANLQLNGFNMDIQHYKKAKILLTDKIKGLEARLLEGREAKAFYQKYNKPLLLTSNQDLGKLFYEVLEQDPIYTDKGSYKTDKITLEKLNLPFIQKLFEKKKYEKALGTYLGQFEREITKGKIHPFFDLVIPVSYRSSSNSPNLQNQPKRDEEIKTLIRAGIVPRKNSVLSEVDFCLTGDTEIETNEGPVTIEAIINRKNKGEAVFVYCYNTTENRIGFSEVLEGRKTRINAEILKITLDNGKTIKCTPDHRFMLRDRTYKQAKDLKTTDSLMPFYKKEASSVYGTKYYVVQLNKENVESRDNRDLEHRLLGRDVLNTTYGNTKNSLLTHHKDGNGLNNKISNLEFITRSEHFSIHSKQGWKNKPNRAHWAQTEKGSQLITAHNKKRNTEWKPEQWAAWKEKLKEGMKKNKVSVGERNHMFGKNHSDEVKNRISLAKRGLLPKKLTETCQICGVVYKNKISSPHLQRKHNMSLPEYRNKFGYNHKIIKIEKVQNEDTYNINVKTHHNFALSAGVIVKNSGAEVITSASYHKDKNFIAYLKDKTTDMHRDNATDLLLLPHEILERKDYTPEQKGRIKVIRFYAKNQWTFAQFYGDWYGSCAPGFWASVVEGGLLLPDGTSCKEWLASKGIYELGELEKGKPTPGSFLEHCQQVENKMWNKRFPEYTQWKKDIVEFYQKYGYIDNLFGFQFVGYMSKNQCTNFPVQSASFHLLLYTLIQTQKMIKRLHLKTKLLGQIHDSILANVPVDEVKVYHQEVHAIVKKLRSTFKWLVVPMEIEVEISQARELGGNLAKMTEVDPLNVELW